MKKYSCSVYEAGLWRQVWRDAPFFPLKDLETAEKRATVLSDDGSIKISRASSDSFHISILVTKARPAEKIISALQTFLSEAE